MDKPKRVEFASQGRLHEVEHLAPRFFQEVLEYDYSNCLVTDESDLYDFACVMGNDAEAEVAAMLDRFTAHYFLDARAAGSTGIVDLLELLAAHGVTG
jgi:hypothetical protein